MPGTNAVRMLAFVLAVALPICSVFFLVLQLDQSCVAYLQLVCLLYGVHKSSCMLLVFLVPFHRLHACAGLFLHVHDLFLCMHR
jgi:hypothetical protein